MSSLVYKCDESMGSFHWETRAYTSNDKKEVSLVQTWFDETKVISKQSVVLMYDELENIIEAVKLYE